MAAEASADASDGRGSATEGPGQLAVGGAGLEARGDGAQDEDYVVRSVPWLSLPSQKLDDVDVIVLTGTDPDRFEEEKRRGLTIDLGFAHTVLPSGSPVSFVDVPGHERFIRNMIAGVGAVLVFVPGLIVLYLFLTLLEDSGYMARVAFVMDRVMRFTGLHGKSFMPMILGFGCAVPAIYSTRTLENRTQRIMTSLLVPLMSCSARMPRSVS